MTPSRHVLVLGDQLTRHVGPLHDADPAATRVLMIESEALARALPHHKQKLVLFFSAMRHFARDLEEDGFDVDYVRAPSLEEGIRDYLSRHAGSTLRVMKPTDYGYEDRFRATAESVGGALDVVPNELWLTSEAEFDEWADGRSTLRLEYFYRAARRRRGWLMEGGEPAGGRWNFDAENRTTPEVGHVFPPRHTFAPDQLTLDVIEEVDAAFPDHFGEARGFGWPVTRADAELALDDFLRCRLASFGPYEDAMVDGEDALYHSLLSPALNLGLLHPAEVCETALAYAAEPSNEVPLQSIEGFVRQILGWREFMRHVYRRAMPELRRSNGLEHASALPELYWSADTRMRCLARTVDQLRRTGHTHHIQRLMVLGNLALLARVDPREVNDWFLTCYVDALDWVVTPNVMGMSQFADLGSFTTKPYAASGKYINRMSDYCGECPYDVRKTVEEDACPLNSLYWDFVDHHADRLSENARMRVIFANWRKRDPDDRKAILGRARTVRRALANGSL